MTTAGIAGPIRRVRVLFLDHTARMSGGEVFLVRLLRGLSDLDCSVVLGEDGPLLHELRSQDVEVEVLPLAPRLSQYQAANGNAGASRRAALFATPAVWRHVRALRHLIKARHPDIVYTNSTKMHVLGGIAARLTGRAHVMHVHEQMTSTNFSPMNLMLLRFSASALPRLVVVNSQSTLRSLPALARNKSVVVPCMAPIPLSPKTDYAVTDILTIGLVGRISAGKGQLEAILAIQELVRRHASDRVRLHIIGDALFHRDRAYRAALTRLVTDLRLDGHVFFLGHVDNTQHLLSSMDVALIPSVAPEGFGQVALEAMACGLPLIASDAGGLKELLTHGVTGLLIPPGDPSAIADAVERLEQDSVLRECLGTNARRESNKYSETLVCGSWRRDVLQNIVGQQGGRRE